MKTIIRINAEENPDYAPYCMRCPGFSRMRKMEPFLWSHKCGAVHDERNEQEKHDSFMRDVEG